MTGTVAYKQGHANGMLHNTVISCAPHGGCALYQENEHKAARFKDSSPYWKGYHDALVERGLVKA